MLSPTEQEQLYKVIVAYIGNDSKLTGAKGSFNNGTIEVVEQMIAADGKCNKAMTDLIIRIIGAGRIRVKNTWLKRALSLITNEMKNSSIRFSMCGTVVKSKWISPIVMSTI